MLTRYSTLKKSIASVGRDIDSIRTSIHESDTVVGQLKIHLDDLIRSNADEVERECELILNRELSKVRDYYAQEHLIVKSFREKEMLKLNKHKYELSSNSNIEDLGFNERYNSLRETFSVVSDCVLAYMSESDLQAYRNLDYGVDLINESLDELKERMKYFDDFRGYDMLVSGVGGVESKIDSVSKDNLIIIVFGAICILVVFKWYILLPYLMYILSTLFIRIRNYYNLIRMIDAYMLLGQLEDLSKSHYHEKVDSTLLVEDEKIRLCVLHLEQICTELNKRIDDVMNSRLAQHRSEFDYERARSVARNSVEKSTERLEITLREEEEKLESLRERLDEAILSRNGLNNDLEVLRKDIKSIYEDLTPSFKEKMLLSEFFLGFDKHDEPVTFNYKKKATLILYEGDTDGQVGAVMSTLKMMCSQIMCAMYPLAYTINVCDTLTGGAPLSAFRAASEDVDTDSGSTLFTVVSTQRGVDNYIDELYTIFEKRKLQVLSKYTCIDEYNAEKLKYNARTLPYLVSFFYHFDYSIIDSNEKLQQISRLSFELGIIPILFVDISRIGIDKKGNVGVEKTFDYKPDIIVNNVSLFTGNIFGFNIDDVVEIITFSNKEVIKTLCED